MTRTNSRPVRILVIEDNDDQWILTKRAIEVSFTSVAPITIRVASSKNALEFLAECLVEEWNMPSLILLDLYLPTLEEGLNLLKQIRGMSPVCKAVPVIMLSSSDAQADITQAYTSGVSSYCLKPNSFEGWVSLFKELGKYWLDTVSLPPRYYSIL